MQGRNILLSQGKSQIALHMATNFAVHIEAQQRDLWFEICILGLGFVNMSFMIQSYNSLQSAEDDITVCMR